MKCRTRTAVQQVQPEIKIVHSFYAVSLISLFVCYFDVTASRYIQFVLFLFETLSRVGTKRSNNDFYKTIILTLSSMGTEILH